MSFLHVFFALLCFACFWGLGARGILGNPKWNICLWEVRRAGRLLCSTTGVQRNVVGIACLLVPISSGAAVCVARWGWGGYGRGWNVCPTAQKHSFVPTWCALPNQGSLKKWSLREGGALESLFQIPHSVGGSKDQWPLGLSGMGI